MFDLKTAVAAWRRSLAYHRAFTGDDLDELEQHLRDQVEGLVADGMSEKNAFHSALREMGDVGVAEVEYRKVYWGKRRRRRELLSEFVWRLSMLRNYLKIAWRNVLREKGYAFINVFGLAVGIAFCVLIFLFVRDELTYDLFNKNSDRIFRVDETTIQANGSRAGGGPTVPLVLGPTLQADVPGIEHYVRILGESHLARALGSDTDAIEETVLYADPAILSVFSFPLESGNAATALSSPDQVVLTKKAARQLFGDEDPVGKTVQLRLDKAFENFIVSGVAADIPGNSTIQFSVLLPFSRLLEQDFYHQLKDSWHLYSVHTFVELAAHTTEKQVERALPDFYARYHQDVIAEQRKRGVYDSTTVATYDLMPLREIHLTSVSDPIYSYILSGIAMAVLLIACINFMTLSIGRSARRAREVGVRKVVGAGRRQVMVQFWGEAFLQTSIALVTALILARAFLPVFNRLTERHLAFGGMADGNALIVLVALALVTGFVAGSYPALVLSRFRPIETLKDRVRIGRSSGFTRALIVVQFAFTVFLLSCTLVMARQLAYTRSMDLGFDKGQIVVIPVSGLDGAQVLERFRTETENEPSVIGVTASGNSLGQRGTMGASYNANGKHHSISVFRVDPSYVDFLGLDLVAGRNFREGAQADSASVIVNETLIRDFGIEDPIGKPVPGPDDQQMMSSEPGLKTGPTIIGVVKDYHFQSLYSEVGNVMLTRDPGWTFDNLLVRIRPEGIQQTLALLKATWRRVAPDVPFNYQFLDDQMQAQYANDRRWSEIIRYGAGFAVLIACLGLLGLAALSVTLRTKEIGIRKVLGATVYHIVGLISREFALLVVVGVAVAVVPAYLVMHRWLEDFAYRVPLSAWVFLAAGAVALGIALGTVGIQALRSATADPVRSLRYE